MADTTTIITGVTDGAFENAFGDLPGWATQETLEEVGITLTKLLKTQNLALAQLIKSAGAKGSALKPEDLEDLSDEVQKLHKNFKKVNETEPKKRRQEKEEELTRKKSVDQWKKDLFSWKTVIAGVITAGLASKKAMTENVNTFDELYRSGINVMTGFNGASSGFEALQQLARTTGTRFTELSESIIKYNTGINALGLGRFAKTLGDTKTQLERFGYTGKEASDLLGAYLESQKGYTEARLQSDAELQKNVVEFGKRMTKLSQATGTLRSKLIEDVAAISESIEASLLYAQVGRDAAESTVEFVASFKDKSIGQAFLKMMTDQIKPLNSTFMEFQKSGFGGFGMKLQRFLTSLKGIDDPKEKARRMAEFTKISQGEFAAMRPILQLQEEAGNQAAGAALKTVTAMEQQSRAYAETGKVGEDTADDTAKSSKRLQNAMEDAAATGQKMFAPTIQQLNIFSASIETANKGINSLIDSSNKTALSWLGVGLAIAGFALQLKVIGSLIDAIRSDKEIGKGRTGKNAPGPGKGGPGRTGPGRAGMGKRIGGSAIGLVAGIGLDYAADSLKESGHEQAAAAADIAASTLEFAGTAAMLGSLFGPIGTLVGGIGGGLVGAGVGAYKNWDALTGASEKPTEESKPPGSTNKEANNEPLKVSANEPFRVLINEPLKVLVNEPLKVLVDDPSKSSINELLKVLINQPFKVSVNEPLKVSMNEPIKALVNEPLKVSMDEPLKVSIGEPFKVSMDEPLKIPTSEPPKEPINELLKALVSKPFKVSIDEPIKVLVTEPLKVSVNEFSKSSMNEIFKSSVSEPLKETFDKTINDFSKSPFGELVRTSVKEFSKSSVGGFIKSSIGEPLEDSINEFFKTAIIAPPKEMIKEPPKASVNEPPNASIKEPPKASINEPSSTAPPEKDEPDEDKDKVKELPKPTLASMPSVTLSDINSTLKDQGTLLKQLLESSNRIVNSNDSIKQYTRMQA